MNRWSQPRKQEQPIEMTKVEIEGSFQCQFCGLIVDTATYVPEAKALTWKCPEQHISYIEEFSI